MLFQITTIGGHPPVRVEIRTASLECLSDWIQIYRLFIPSKIRPR
jgi:hypothetical protein